MDAAQVHLAVDHFPVVGAVLFVPLMVLALWMPRSRGALAAALLLSAVSAAASLISLLSGDAALAAMEPLSGISGRALSEHQGLARVSMGMSVAVAVGGGALFAAAVRQSRTPMLPGAMLLSLGAATAGAMALTAHAGGAIHHPEVWSHAGAREVAAWAAEIRQVEIEGLEGEEE
jgi:hypothetical protein